MKVTCLEKRVVAGVEMVVFRPTPKMQLYAMSLYCDPEAPRRTPEELCRHIGIPENSYDGFLKFEPWFSEWLEDRRLKLGGKSRRAALEAIGMEMALSGEFQFWKPLAIREGVIAADKLELGVSLPASLEQYKEMDANDLRALENSVMAALRGEGAPDAGEITLVEGPQGWRQEGDPGGDPQVPGSLVLADQLGADGERALSGLEPF